MSDTQKPQGKKKLTSAERRARTAFLKAEREARQRVLEEKWKAQVGERFGYLETEYGFHFAGVDGSNWWGTYVYYRSPLLQVEIDRSVESGGVELNLIRLVDGQVPDPRYPLVYEIGMPVNFIYFDAALRERVPEEYEKIAALPQEYAKRSRDIGLTDEMLERKLALHADALRAYFDDVLRGDLTIFDEETERWRQRKVEHLRQRQQDQAQKGCATPPDDETPFKQA
ncbi:MAG TPA: hypothetical protein VE338_06055 [Ktedonobacterales bacterium]|jgi:hypothetical protein|nr:hypothetical protein [Ktedonobacterales bacterium]